MLVYGDLNLDIFFVLDRDEIVLRDVSYLSQTGAAVPGGCGGNVSVALSRLGLETVLVSSVGSDVFGGMLVEDLAAEKVGTAHVKGVEGASTGIMVIVLRRGGERTIIGYRGANVYNTLSREESRALVGGVDYTFISGFTCGNVDRGKTIEYLIESSAELGVAVGVDLGGVSKGFLLERLRRYRGLLHDVFLNSDELEEMLGGDLRSSVTDLVSVLMPRNLFLKMGSEGSLVYSGGRASHVEAVRVDGVVDTTGCGDAYDAGAIYGLNAGLSPVQRAMLGNLMGAYKARGLGARHLPRDIGDLRRFAEEHLGNRGLPF